MRTRRKVEGSIVGHNHFVTADILRDPGAAPGDLQRAAEGSSGQLQEPKTAGDPLH